MKKNETKTGIISARKSKEINKNPCTKSDDMYKKDDGQITIAEFNSPFGKLDKENRWMKIADMIPWHRYEEKYAGRFCENNGASNKLSDGNGYINNKTTKRNFR